MRLRDLCIVLVLSWLMSCNQQEMQEQQAIDPIAISAQEITQETYPQVLQRTGNIRPWEQVFIAGNPNARINNILADVGDNVNKGELLVRMNQSQLQQADAQLELARKNYQRLDTLLELGSISQQRYDQAQTEYENALNNYELLKENTVLTSPISGVVTQKHFFEGEQFSPSANSPSILTIMQIMPVKVVLNVSQDYFSRLDQGMQTDIMVDNYPDTTFAGTVWKKFPVIDETSHTFTVEIRMENEDKLLRPGMFADVEIPLTTRTGLFVPVSAIVDQPGSTQQYLFVVEGDSVNQIEVNTDFRVRDKILVEEGLQPGSMVVTEGMAKLQQGDKVKIIDKS